MNIHTSFLNQLNIIDATSLFTTIFFRLNPKSEVLFSMSHRKKNVTFPKRIRLFKAKKGSKPISSYNKAHAHICE